DDGACACRASDVSLPMPTGRYADPRMNPVPWDPHADVMFMPSRFGIDRPEATAEEPHARLELDRDGCCRTISRSETERSKYDSPLYDAPRPPVPGPALDLWTMFKIALDIAGFIPGAGDAVDAISVGIEVIEGDYI